MPETNPIVQEVINTIRRDLLANRSFINAILKDVKLTKENIDPKLILSLMAEFSPNQQPPMPKSNRPKEVSKGKAVLRPIAVGSGSMEASIISDLLVGNNVYIYGKAGTGKAQPLSAKILCEHGWKTFAEIQVGDKVWGQDGKLYAVDGVFDRGVKSVYRVSFNDGGYTETCDEHLWKIQTRNDRNYKREGSVLPLSEFKDNIKTSSGRANAYIDIAKAIPFFERKHIVDPYLMGVLLGDGSITQKNISISNPSKELFESLVLPEGVELSERACDDKCLTYGIRAKSKKKGYVNTVTEELQRHNLFGKKSINKFIPNDYLYDSIENRIALLQGLNDTDGYSDETSFEFSTSSEQLAHDYTELVRSLGGTAKVIHRVPIYVYNGIKKEGHLSFRVNCVFPDNIMPFRLAYKAERYHKPTKYFPKRFVESVTYKGTESVRCISVTNPQHLYITDDYIVTHNTYLAKALVESAMGQKAFIINCSQWTSPVQIIGGQTIKGYAEGLLIQAWAEGGILILDELPKLDPNTAGLLNDALAETSTQPKYDSDGKVIEGTIPYIVNGRGEKIYKGQDQPDEDLKFRFAVIGTGNTDMKTVSNKFSGNQRQDYSLVDRFAGSYFALDYAAEKEKMLTYSYVYKVANAIRMFLDKEDSVESISLRTMLNFNRTYEQEMLWKLGNSPFADDIRDNSGNEIPPKSFSDSISSFIGMLAKDKRLRLEEFEPYREAIETPNTIEQFTAEFKAKYGLDPQTGDAVE